MKRARRWLVILVLLMTLVLIAEFVVGTGMFFGWTSVCRLCGSERMSQTIFWVPVHSYEDTEVSRFVKAEGLRGEHKHEWLFVHGGGGGVFCAIGNGRLPLDNARYKPIVSFLRTIAQHRDPDESRKWLDRFLDPEQASRARHLVHLSESSELEPDETFDSWYEETCELWDQLSEEHDE